MDRSHLEIDHFKYAMLSVKARYSKMFPNGFVFNGNIADALMDIATKFYDASLAGIP